MKLLGQAIEKLLPELKYKKYEETLLGQRSRSNVTNFQPLLAFTTGHIPSKLHQFPTNSFCVDRQTDTQTDTAKNAICFEVKDALPR